LRTIRVNQATDRVEVNTKLTAITSLLESIDQKLTILVDAPESVAKRWMTQNEYVRRLYLNLLSESYLIIFVSNV
jgi:hypothetical protein